jgi:hypothetical protein
MEQLKKTKLNWSSKLVFEMHAMGLKDPVPQKNACSKVSNSKTHIKHELLWRKWQEDTDSANTTAGALYWTAWKLKWVGLTDALWTMLGKTMESSGAAINMQFSWHMKMWATQLNFIPITK